MDNNEMFGIMVVGSIVGNASTMLLILIIYTLLQWACYVPEQLTPVAREVPRMEVVVNPRNVRRVHAYNMNDFMLQEGLDIQTSPV